MVGVIIMDFMSTHRYGKVQAINSTHRKNELNRFQAKWDIPFIFGECGIPDHAAGLYVCMDNSFANDIWATAFLGGFGTGLNWWWQNTLPLNQHLLFNPLSEFINSIDFENNNFIVKRAGQYPVESPTVEYVSLIDNDGKTAIGWIHNFSVYWKNLYYKYEDCILEKKLDKHFDEVQVPRKVRCKKIPLKGFQAGKLYSVKWFNTRTGKWTNDNKELKANNYGKIKLHCPLLGVDPEITSSPTDYGFIIELKE